jgi:hypothetical protein
MSEILNNTLLLVAVVILFLVVLVVVVSVTGRDIELSHNDFRFSVLESATRRPAVSSTPGSPNVQDARLILLTKLAEGWKATARFHAAATQPDSPDGKSAAAAVRVFFDRWDNDVADALTADSAGKERYTHAVDRSGMHENLRPLEGLRAKLERLEKILSKDPWR